MTVYTRKFKENTTMSLRVNNDNNNNNNNNNNNDDDDDIIKYGEKLRS